MDLFTPAQQPLGQPVDSSHSQAFPSRFLETITTSLSPNDGVEGKLISPSL